MTFSLAHQPLSVRRAIFVSANVLAALVVYFLLVDPILRLVSDHEDDIAQRRATLARYEAVSRQESAVQAFAKQVADSNTRGDLIDGASAGIVDANLQARLKALAEHANITVRSIQMLPIKTLRGASLVGARLDVSGSMEALHSLVRALEGESPLLLINAATMRSQQTFWGVLPAAGKQEKPAALSVDAQFDVFGGALLKEHP